MLVYSLTVFFSSSSLLICKTKNEVVFFTQTQLTTTSILPLFFDLELALNKAEKGKNDEPGVLHDNDNYTDGRRQAFLDNSEGPLFANGWVMQALDER